jgi:hypothetical protein
MHLVVLFAREIREVLFGEDGSLDAILINLLKDNACTLILFIFLED